MLWLCHCPQAPRVSPPLAFLENTPISGVSGKPGSVGHTGTGGTSQWASLSWTQTFGLALPWVPTQPALSLYGGWGLCLPAPANPCTEGPVGTTPALHGSPGCLHETGQVGKTPLGYSALRRKCPCSTGLIRGHCACWGEGSWYRPPTPNQVSRAESQTLDSVEFLFFIQKAFISSLFYKNQSSCFELKKKFPE